MKAKIDNMAAKNIKDDVYCLLSGFDHAYIYDIRKQKKSVQDFDTKLGEDFLTNTFEIHSDGHTMVFGNKTGILSVIDMRKPKNCLKKFRNHIGSIMDIKIENDNLYTGKIKSFL